MSTNDGKKRITVTVSHESYEELLKMKELNGNSVDKNASKLIDQAIKDRKRRRKNDKEDSSEDNAADLG